MAERQKNMRDILIQAGIDEINTHGVTAFSIRRVAEACKVSCAAPYKHFKDKREFIAAIIDYVNDQWRTRQQEVLSACGGGLREQIVEICVNYVRFLMEKPFYRSILMMKDREFDSIYHKVRGQISNRSLNLVQAAGYEGQVLQRKFHLVRAMLFGTVFLIDTGELDYNEETMAHLRYTIDREFDLP